MRHLRQAASHRLADGLLSIGNHPADRHWHGLLDLREQGGEISSRAAEQAPRQQHLSGHAVADDPEHFMSDIGLHAVDGQDHLPLLLEPFEHPLLIGQVQCHQLARSVRADP